MYQIKKLNTYQLSRVLTNHLIRIKYLKKTWRMIRWNEKPITLYFSYEVTYGILNDYS